VRRDQDRREMFINPSDWKTLQRHIEDIRTASSGVGGLVELFGEEAYAYMDGNHGLVRKHSLHLLIFNL
jgi:hypothetical protein